MKRKLCLLLLGMAVLVGTPVFAQDDDEIVIDLGSASDDEFNQVLDSSTDIDMATKEEAEAPAEEETVVAEEPADTEEAAIAEEPADAEEAAIAEEIAGDEEEPAEPVVPYRVRNNKYFQESQRFARLAEGTYTLGDYDASTDYANEAIRNAELSDEYVALQMKIREANSAIAAAKYRIDWAVSSGASQQFPVEFREAETWYNESLSARIAEEWDAAIDAAHRVIELLAYIDAPKGTLPLPAQYTVRAWTTFRDCLWNIAGRPWVYGNPRQWRVLYNANRAKFPDPNNPNWIEPGMVLDIPSIKGEFRQGAWDGSKTYPPIE
jgi:nucleoid-associated protein YgaU